MCGICGFFLFGNSKEKKFNLDSTLDNMSQALIHRGPDQYGLHKDTENDIYLAHRRLSIIDTSKAGIQPMSNEDETCFLLANGEIYNYKELAASLKTLGHRFKSDSDSEVILHLYEMHGEDCLSHLNGMFAFVIWDKKNKTLFGARDRLGIKPFYYLKTEKELVFASEIKSILKYPIDVSCNYCAVSDYLTFGFCLEDKTFFKDIFSLPPAHYFLLKGGRFETKRYWSMPLGNEICDEGKAESEIKELLFDAVNLHLRSDVPLGCYLSGGLDSSTVSIIASKFLKSPLKTFTGAFDLEGYDERKYARIVASNINAELYEKIMSYDELLHSIKDIIWFLDYPVVGPGAFPQYLISKLASQNVKVVLGGQGGDELFAGYPHHLKLYEIGTNFKKSFFGKNSPEQEYYKNLYGGNYKFFEGLFTIGFRKKLSGYSPYEGFMNCWKKLPGNFFQKAFVFEIENYLQGLLQVEDRLSMAFSLESRVPLLDFRLVELASRIPLSLKIKNGQLKYILKKAQEGILPKEILQRTDKMGFPVPISDWISDVLKTPEFSINETGIFETKKLKKSMDLHSKKNDLSYSLWKCLSIKLWQDIFLKNE